MASSKIAGILLVIGLVTGAGSGFFGAGFIIYQPQISKLQSDLSDVQSQLSQLSSDHDSLLAEYERLESEYNELDLNHIQLTLYFESLKENYQKLEANYNSLYLTYGQLEADYASLTEKYNELDLEHNQLQTDYNNLSSQYYSLKSSYEDLEFEYNKLESMHNDLSASYWDLWDKYSELRGKLQEFPTVTLPPTGTVSIEEYNALVDKYNSLVNKYNLLLEQTGEALFPPYTVISGRNVTWGFKTSDGEMHKWDMPIDTYRSYITSPYPYKYKTLINTETGETYYVRDYTLFVEDWSFRKVIPSLYSEINDERQFVYEIWYIVSQLTIYSADITDTPRWSLETLTEAGGDCEDTSILVASMLKCAPVDYTIKLVYMDMHNPTDPQTVNHCIVYVEWYEDGTKYSRLIETTSKTVMDPYTEGVRGWYFEV